MRQYQIKSQMRAGNYPVEPPWHASCPHCERIFKCSENSYIVS